MEGESREFEPIVMTSDLRNMATVKDSKRRINQMNRAIQKKNCDPVRTNNEIGNIINRLGRTIFTKGKSKDHGVDLHFLADL